METLSSQRCILDSMLFPTLVNYLETPWLETGPSWAPLTPTVSQSNLSLGLGSMPKTVTRPQWRLTTWTYIKEQLLEKAGMMLGNLLSLGKSTKATHSASQSSTLDSMLSNTMALSPRDRCPVNGPLLPSACLVTSSLQKLTMKPIENRS